MFFFCFVVVFIPGRPCLPGYIAFVRLCVTYRRNRDRSHKVFIYMIAQIQAASGKELVGEVQQAKNCMGGGGLGKTPRRITVLVSIQELCLRVFKIKKKKSGDFRLTKF